MTGQIITKSFSTDQIASLFGARRVGPHRYQGHCPVHPDRTPSLSIDAGDDGRTLVLCRAGCATGQILAAKGLEMRDLFTGPPRSRREIAAAIASQQERESAIHRLHQLHAAGCDELHVIQEAIQSLGARLMSMGDGPEGDELTDVYHELLDRERKLEPILIAMERGMAR